MSAFASVLAWLVPVGLVLWISTLSYRTALLWCDVEDIITPTAAGDADGPTLRVLLVADPHIVGGKRSIPDQVWTNWHIANAYSHAVGHADPDFVVGLGDMLDEGWQSMRTREMWVAYSGIALSSFNLGDGGSSGSGPTFFGYVV